MMVNLANQRPGDRWKVGHHIYELIDRIQGGPPENVSHRLHVRKVETGEEFVLVIILIEKSALVEGDDV